MARRLISTSRSEIRAMSAAELKESIRDSEGRVVLCQNYVGLHPLVDGSTNAELVNTYTTMGVDGIVPFPDMTAGVGPYKEAYEAGIAIGLVNGILPDADFTTAYYGYTQDVLGSGNVECAVKFINEQLGGKPVIINALGFSVGSFSGPRWTEFQRGLAEAFGEEAATPVATIDNGAQADEMMTRIGDALNANPEANIVFCGYEASCQGAIAAIENAGLQGKVFVFAVDCSEQMCNWMLNEDNVILVGCATQDPYMEAYKATEDVILQLTGEKIPEKLGVVTYLDATSLNIGDRDAVKAYLEYLKGFSGN